MVGLVGTDANPVFLLRSGFWCESDGSVVGTFAESGASPVDAVRIRWGFREVPVRITGSSGGFGDHHGGDLASLVGSGGDLVMHRRESGGDLVQFCSVAFVQC